MRRDPMTYWEALASTISACAETPSFTGRQQLPVCSLRGDYQAKFVSSWKQVIHEQRVITTGISLVLAGEKGFYQELPALGLP